MSDWFGQQVQAGSLFLAVPVALLVGLISFFSPCVVPLLPGYLSYATGLSGADLMDAEVTRRRRLRMLAGSSLFVLGFAVVFVLLGTTVGAVGARLYAHKHELTIVLGLLNIALGLVFVGMIPFAQREWRIHSVPAVGLAAAPLLGFLFGLGWVPCVSPTLGVIQTIAFTEGTPGRGAVLSAAYALGLGLPFILAGVAFERMLVAVRWIRRRQRWVTGLGGLLLIGVGVLMLTGAWDWLTTWLQGHLVQGFEVNV